MPAEVGAGTGAPLLYLYSGPTREVGCDVFARSGESGGREASSARLVPRLPMPSSIASLARDAGGTTVTCAVAGVLRASASGDSSVPEVESGMRRIVSRTAALSSNRRSRTMLRACLSGNDDRIRLKLSIYPLGK